MTGSLFKRKLLGASKDSHGHCFSFNLQTASMFYVKKSWQPTIFLSLFIIQEEQRKIEKRSVKVKHGSVFTPGHEQRGLLPGQKTVVLLSLHFVESFTVNTSY